ncbi:MAG TPA: glycosyltransferase family 39 protein [Ignavibacteria bacterium]|nr:glycosyltransferase family 39 protein [Ignavibacteria bacterium]
MLILLFSFAVKIILAFTVREEIRSDSLDYYQLAQSINNTGEYTFEGKTTARNIPGYPFFIAMIFKVFGENILCVKFIQSIIEIFTCLLFFLLCLKFLDTKYSLITLAIFAFFPSNVLYSQTLLSEPLFNFFEILLLYLCLRSGTLNTGKIILLGLLWGAAIMIRSSFALSVFIVPLFIFFHQRKLFEGYAKNRLNKSIKYSVLFLVGVFIFVFPWMLRNKIELGGFSLATQAGFTFWGGSNPNATGTWYYQIEESNPLFNEQDEIKKDREFWRQGIDYAIHNPHKFLIVGVKKIGYLFSSERMILLYFMPDENKARTSTEVYKSINPLYVALVNLPYFAVMLFGIWGLLTLKKNNFLIWSFILSWMLMFFLFVALSRYHYVLIPFFILGTGNALYLGKNLFKNLDIKRKIIGIAFCLFVIGVWISEFYLLYK